PHPGCPSRRFGAAPLGRRALPDQANLNIRLGSWRHTGGRDAGNALPARTALPILPDATPTVLHKPQTFRASPVRHVVGLLRDGASGICRHGVCSVWHTRVCVWLISGAISRVVNTTTTAWRTPIGRCRFPRLSTHRVENHRYCC